LVAGFFLLLEFCVNVEKQVFIWSLLTGFFGLEAVYSYGDGYARDGVFWADVDSPGCFFDEFCILAFLGVAEG